uniref:Uncharacterized protein n=1 Tax=viral metagenome TaxID=1070528 RepID=A0A6H1ZX18_9ZZZZ
MNEEVEQPQELEETGVEQPEVESNEAEEAEEQTVSDEIDALLGGAESEETETQEIEQAEVSKEQAVITDEIIKKFPMLKSFKGKPVEETFNAYEHLSRKLSPLSQKVKELQTQLENKAEVKSEIKEELERIDLLELEPEEQLKAIDKLIDRRLESRLKAFEAKLMPLERTARENEEARFLSEIQSVIPEGLKAVDVLGGWREENKEVLFDEEGNPTPLFQAYVQMPELLKKEVAKYGKTLKPDKATNVKDNSIDYKKRVQKAQREAEQKKSGVQYNLGHDEELNDAEKLLMEINQILE